MVRSVDGAAAKPNTASDGSTDGWIQEEWNNYGLRLLWRAGIAFVFYVNRRRPRDLSEQALTDSA
jgi:hypothetical protein